MFFAHNLLIINIIATITITIIIVTTNTTPTSVVEVLRVCHTMGNTEHLYEPSVCNRAYHSCHCVHQLQLGHLHVCFR